jgi:hypothetical protein
MRFPNAQYNYCVTSCQNIVDVTRAIIVRQLEGVQSNEEQLLVPAAAVIPAPMCILKLLHI